VPVASRYRLQVARPVEQVLVECSSPVAPLGLTLRGSCPPLRRGCVELESYPSGGPQLARPVEERWSDRAGLADDDAPNIGPAHLETVGDPRAVMAHRDLQHRPVNFNAHAV
jgi:hypothetical protein